MDAKARTVLPKPPTPFGGNFAVRFGPRNATIPGLKLCHPHPPRRLD